MYEYQTQTTWNEWNNIMKWPSLRKKMQQNNIMLYEFIRLIRFSGLWLCLSIYEHKHEFGQKHFDGYILSYAEAAWCLSRAKLMKEKEIGYNNNSVHAYYVCYIQSKLWLRLGLLQSITIRINMIIFNLIIVLLLFDNSPYWKLKGVKENVLC